MVPPDIAFQHAANAAAAVYADAPPWVTYRVVTHVSAPSLHKSRDVARDVAVRTQDDLAVIQDLPQGANALGHGFPITPVFDALSYFVLSWKVGRRMDVSSYVHDVIPLTYATVSSQADVVVVRLRHYKVEYAADSSDAPSGRTHLTLTPYAFVKAQGNPDTTFYLHELVVDNASGLPVSVGYDGDEQTSFVVDYGMRDAHWVIEHAHYETTLHGPLHVGLLHVIADAKYDRFVFPTSQPDPRLPLLPKPTPVPSPTAEPSPTPAASPATLRTP